LNHISATQINGPLRQDFCILAIPVDSQVNFEAIQIGDIEEVKAILTGECQENCINMSSGRTARSET